MTSGGETHRAELASPTGYDMKSASLVQDVGPAMALPRYIKYSVNKDLHLRNMAQMLACVRQFLATIGAPSDVSMDDLDAYFQTTSRNRAFGVLGTTPGNGTIWLFLLARALQPQRIVESGVYHGSSLFTFRAAVPRAKLFAFDVSFATLLSRLDGVDYREHDWGTDDVRAESPSDLCFFDDHINNCLRLRQAYERGFRHVVVDDSPDIGEIHQLHFPAVPTVSMVTDDKWTEGDMIEWNWQGRRLRYVFRLADTHGAKDIIETAYRFPSLTRWTGMDDALHYYVRLKTAA